MISCERPGVAGASPYRFSNFSVQNMILNAVGTQINSAFPLAVRVATLNLQADAALMLISLSTSIVNALALDTVGIFLGIDRGLTVSLDGGFDLFLSHISRQNSLAGLPVASSRCNSLDYGTNSAYKLPSSVNLALYACSGNLADNELSAVASIFWTPAASLGG